MEIGKTFAIAHGTLTSLGTDSVSGKFTAGGNVPRMTPARNLYKVSYAEDSFNASISLQDVSGQDNVATDEETTEGYQMLDLNLSKTIKVGAKSNLTLSAFGKNLLDEVARNHTCLSKTRCHYPEEM